MQEVRGSIPLGSTKSLAGQTDTSPALPRKQVKPRREDGAIAQLGERLHGMQEVRGSIPLGSTNFPMKFIH